MQALFDKELIRMAQELRDLKTSHAIPVGSLNLYQKEGSGHSGGYYSNGLYVRVTTKPGEPTYPYTQIFITATDNKLVLCLYQEQAFAADGTISQYFYYIRESDFDVRAICSSDFDLIVKQYEEGDWIEDGA